MPTLRHVAFYTSKPYKCKYKNTEIGCKHDSISNIIVGAVFVLVSLLVVTIVTCALVQNHTGLVSKFLPSTQSDEIDISEEEYGEDGSIRTVKQFRFRSVGQSNNSDLGQ